MKPNYGICGFPVLLPVTVLNSETGSCEFPVVTPASSPYPVDKTPMHETEGDDCRCFERKEG